MSAVMVHALPAQASPACGLRTQPFLKARMAWAVALVWVLAMLVSGFANASTTLRVEARPVSDPIKAYVRVTDANGNSVNGLTAADFTVLVDGVAVASPTLSPSPAQDPTQRVSVVFVLDFSGSVIGASLEALQQSVISFINAMQPGDYAAIVKFNASNPNKASVVQQFTQIDDGAGTSALISAVMAPYPGSGAQNESNLFDAVKVAAEQFSATGVTLPRGPRAIVVASDGDDNASTVSGNVGVDLANQAGAAIFTIGVGTVGTRGLEVLRELAARTGGQYIAAPTDAQISAAYNTILNLLNNEYVLSFTSSISDCGSHTLEVRVAGYSSAISTFTRCTAPPPNNSGGGGGGGAVGLLEILAGVSILALRRRRRTGVAALLVR